jgi:elongation factor 1-alpha
LNKDYLPKPGDVMIVKKDTSLKTPKTFQAQVQVLDHPGELKKGYTPIVQVKTAKAPCKILRIVWKIGKETNKAKAENPEYVKANDVAMIEFEVNPQHPIIVDSFDKSEAFGRIAILEGNQAVMLGRVMAVGF